MKGSLTLFKAGSVGIKEAATMKNVIMFTLKLMVETVLGATID